MTPPRIVTLRYLVAVPLPRLDRRGRRIGKVRQERARDRLMRAFGRWFGGATAMPCAGTWQPLDDRTIMVDKGQIVVVSMTTKRQFRRRRPALARLVGALADELDQEAMAVISFPTAEGWIVFDPK
jgi:hypothetical protein